ncbi:TolB family protein [Sporosarcina sp. NPDC096371]|uniref:TolB family protein n=1 Tax=Sporosarcina sp. NPDC096371 TaxID=3364530 RepID=UPI0037FD16DC
MMKMILMCFTIVIISIQYSPLISAESNEVLKAAFVKNDDLWIQIGEKETRITNGEYIRYPQWSFDGNWIAYIRGAKKTELQLYVPLYEGDLWLYNVKKNRHFKVSPHVNKNFQWAPNNNVIALQSDADLKTINVQSLNLLQNITSGIENFSWLPDGSGFLTSSKAGKSVFSDILLSKVLLNQEKNQYQPHHFYTITVGKNDYFYGTSQFKWSYDHRWIAFQLVPTASLSADSNTISILSNDGIFFDKIDEMLNYDEWFQWAPTTNSLGYIEGSNRFSIQNKKLKVKNIFNNSNFLYTPNGYVDRDLVWKTDNQIFVSRSLESDWVDVELRPMPSIYHINLQTKKQSKITSPPSKDGDFYPKWIRNGHKLLWIRTDRDKASVLIANSNGENQEKWIEEIDLGTWYYEHWEWDEVFSLYQP